jgi:chromosome segregation ATPase
MKSTIALALSAFVLSCSAPVGPTGVPSGSEGTITRSLEQSGGAVAQDDDLEKRLKKCEEEAEKCRKDAEAENRKCQDAAHKKREKKVKDCNQDFKDGKISQEEFDRCLNDADVEKQRLLERCRELQTRQKDLCLEIESICKERARLEEDLK